MNLPILSTLCGKLNRSNATMVPLPFECSTILHKFSGYGSQYEYESLSTTTSAAQTISFVFCHSKPSKSIKFIHVFRSEMNADAGNRKIMGDKLMETTLQHFVYQNEKSDSNIVSFEPIKSE